MRKLLLAATLILSSTLVHAETLTPDMIKQIHDQVKNSFFDGCSKDLKGSAIDICRCLADKTQANLDDKALSKCNNDDSGKDCVTKAVKDASTKATSKDSIMECKKKVEATTTSNTPNTTTITKPAATSSPAAAAPASAAPSTAAPGATPAAAPTAPTPATPSATPNSNKTQPSANAAKTISKHNTVATNSTNNKHHKKVTES